MNSRSIAINRRAKMEAIIHRDGPDCFLCKEPINSEREASLDHWVPRSKGGSWETENLRRTHKVCNSRKGDVMPNPDGSIDYPNRSERKSIKRPERPIVCDVCEAGRKLGAEEECNSCGSGPMPFTYPRWAKLSPKDCPHRGPWWCWYECFEPGLREPAIVDVLDANGTL